MSYRKLVLDILARMAKDNQKAALYDLIVDQVAAEKQTKDEPLAPNYRYLIRRTLKAEAQAGWLTLTGDGSNVVAAFTDAGVTHYADTDVPAIAEQARSDARSEYLKLAGMVQEAVGALQGSAAAVRACDMQGLPDIVRSSLDVVVYLEEVNEEILERYNHVNMRLAGY